MLRRMSLGVALTLLAGTLLTGCGGANQIIVIANVNGHNITYTEYQQELAQAEQYFTTQQNVDFTTAAGKKMLPTVQNLVVDSLVDRALLNDYVQKHHITVNSTDEQKRINNYASQACQGDPSCTSTNALNVLKAQLAQSNISWATFMSNYVDQPLLEEAVAGPPTVLETHARHILVKDLATANTVENLLKQGGDFATLAKKYSIDTASAAQGGDLGWFPKGQMVAEFDSVAFTLTVSTPTAPVYSGPVKSQFGYHIIQVLGRGQQPDTSSNADQTVQTNFQTWAQQQRTDPANHVQLWLPFTPPTVTSTPNAPTATPAPAATVGPTPTVDD